MLPPFPPIPLLTLTIRSSNPSTQPVCSASKKKLPQRYHQNVPPLSTLTPSSLDVPRDALEPSRCFGRGYWRVQQSANPTSQKSSSSSSNSKGMLPDTLPSLLGASNGDLTLCWISSLPILQNLHSSHPRIPPSSK